MVAADFCEANMAPPRNVTAIAMATASLSVERRARSILQPQSLPEGHSHAELKVPAAAPTLGDVEAQADQCQVHVGAAADAEVERLVGKPLSVRIRCAVVGEDLHAEPAD